MRSRITENEVAPGYLNHKYAESFREFGSPRYLERSGAWIIERGIRNTGAKDAMGPYPLFCCRRWDLLADDLKEMERELVSVTVVTDPFGVYDEALLEKAFDRVVPYKDHFVAETTEAPGSYVSRSHQTNARRALRKVEVEICESPEQYLDEWMELFDDLASKHGISGVRAFSRDSFEMQLRVPGIVMFRAEHKGRTVGIDLWYVQDDVAQGHLVAFSAEGYRVSASYATKWVLLDYFTGKVRWVNFGGLPGSANSLDSGLGHFKSGWSNTTRKAYLCGRILDPDKYRRLSVDSNGSGYFPAYRAGEMA